MVHVVQSMYQENVNVQSVYQENVNLRNNQGRMNWSAILLEVAISAQVVAIRNSEAYPSR